LEALARTSRTSERPGDAIPQRAAFSSYTSTRPRVHPKIVSEMLGHSTVAIIVDVYSHVTPAMHREAARVMDQLLSR